jgi:hypothetical protein
LRILGERFLLLEFDFARLIYLQVFAGMVSPEDNFLDDVADFITTLSQLRISGKVTQNLGLVQKLLKPVLYMIVKKHLFFYL